MAREYFCAYHSLSESLKPYSDAECGRLFRAALMYSATGEAEEFRGNERFIWPTIQGMIDRDRAAYDAKCASRAENGKKGGRPSKANGFPENLKKQMVFCESKKSQEKEKEEDKDKEKEKEDLPEGSINCARTRERFIPPTLEEVREYCRERDLTVDPDAFYTYFSEGGWVDAKGQKVKSWKQKLLTWARFDTEHGEKRPTSGTIQSAQPTAEDVARMKRFLEKLKEGTE